MASREAMPHFQRKADSDDLRDAVKVIRRLRINFLGATREHVCRVLTNEADILAEETP